MMGGAAAGRVVLFLQGPHGPFFRRLARALADRGAETRRIAFNRADEAEWAGAGPLQRYCGRPGDYAPWLAHQIARHRVTDIVLYGDSRPEHAPAIEIARARGIVCHCLEEGYLRPHHVTYERGGSNGNSRLHRITASEISRAMGPAKAPDAEAPDGWGAHRAHLWHSALYHGRLLLPSRHFPPPDRRRGIGLWHEVGLYGMRLAGLPWRRLWQGVRARRVLGHGAPFFVVALQLSFDASMRAYSRYRNPATFVEECVQAFADGAPLNVRLVFKSHPFEDGRDRLRRVIRRAAEAAGVEDRVVFLDGGVRLGALLGRAEGVVTINSTAGQQALWRGLPVAALGRAVYARAGLVSDQALAEFFAAPNPVNPQAYWQFRSFLTASSQLRGSFYAPDGIAQALKQLPEAILDPHDPYDRVLKRIDCCPNRAARGIAPMHETAADRPELPAAPETIAV